VISGVPQIVTSFLFSFVIFAWAAIYHNTTNRASDPFKRFQPLFILMNSTVAVAVAVCFAMIAFTSGHCGCCFPRRFWSRWLVLNLVFVD
jgi:hypothetical protein